MKRQIASAGPLLHAGACGPLALAIVIWLALLSSTASAGSGSAAKLIADLGFPESDVGFLLVDLGSGAILA